MEQHSLIVFLHLFSRKWRLSSSYMIWSLLFHEKWTFMDMLIPFLQYPGKILYFLEVCYHTNFTLYQTKSFL